MTTQSTPASALPERVQFASPCKGVCDPGDVPFDGWICRGCFRTQAEVAIWGRATDEEKRQITLNTIHRARQLTIGT
jgi:predicted Fe-S protein YdhL (DUF1289 family)